MLKLNNFIIFSSLFSLSVNNLIIVFWSVNNLVVNEVIISSIVTNM